MVHSAFLTGFWRWPGGVPPALALGALLAAVPVVVAAESSGVVNIGGRARRR
jgi:hypothetical protein